MVKKADKIKEYVRANVWKRFFKYKLYELGIIPTIAIVIWKLPLWIGWGFIKLFNIDPTTATFFCKDTGASAMQAICDGVNYSSWSIWGCGVVILLILGVFICANWKIAKENVIEEAQKKFH
jgi:hypothetical protein